MENKKYYLRVERTQMTLNREFMVVNEIRNDTADYFELKKVNKKKSI